MRTRKMKMVFNDPNPTAPGGKEKDPLRDARKSRQISISCGVYARRRWLPIRRR
jgi:hypothetical protein